MPRECCSRCHRPVQVCLCKYITCSKSPMNLVVLQHPSEQKKAIGTAKLLGLCIKNCSRIVGECFSNHKTFEEILQQPCVVLFPNDSAITLHEFQHDYLQGTDIQSWNLIVIDGTWKKAKKIWYLNPQLHTLPSIVLSQSEPSTYRIRKVPNDAYLSTVEAAVMALRGLANDQTILESPLVAFKAMIDQQIQIMGNETYQNNYQK
ncbi:tRNA-uridine aminocarboxypropyltransferase [Zooshikella harenae]|uniref:tRNA-uridine aminocarboxypropyltransferase n=1 Tax=Zooshikella harenae TaxID=2827238 RepID=A0ABS5Z6H8_9GAMM|nr:tRNA-uridine aminocarboxypropyltransferase [Zooshikella harenae]MBU2709657.1 DTW domain-containing protein [Zooshikella harenae]